MRVLIWPPGDPGRDGSTFYRLTEPARVLSAQGCDVVVDTVGPRVHWDRRWAGDIAPLDAHPVKVDPVDADVVVMLRPARWHWATLIPMLQAHGTRIVVDIDDDFHAIPDRNAARAALDPATSPQRNWRWIAEAARRADLVTVTTPALAKVYGQHGRVRVLPNLVPAALLDVAADPIPDTVGWTGSIDTHPGDLESTAGGIARALSESGWRMHVVGTGAGVRHGLRLDHDPTVTGWLPIDGYHQQMARPAIGVVPLTLSRFNAAKSALKMGEFAALGVPVVASPTADNRRLHSHGVGVLARTGREWETALRRLIDHPAERAELAARGRAAMAALTYEQWADLWWDAWESTLTGRAVA